MIGSSPLTETLAFIAHFVSKVSKMIGLYGLEGSSCKRGVCVAETGSIRLTRFCTIVL